MTDKQPSSQLDQDRWHQSREFFCVITADEMRALQESAAFDGREWLRRIWSRRAVLAMFVVAFTALSLTYSMTASPWYRASVVLVAREQPALGGLSAQLAQLGSLAGLVGLTVGSTGKTTPLAILRSRGFAKRFIEDESLLPVLFAEKWDQSTGAWKASAQRHPDVRDGVRYLHEKVLRVSDDKRTGLVTLYVEWTDAEQAARWANLLAERINRETREQAVAEASANIEFLSRELETVTVLSLQQSISRLLETELQKLMAARGAEQFSYTVVDPAETPKRRIRPKPLFLSLTGGIAGLLLGVVYIALTTRPNRRSSPAG